MNIEHQLYLFISLCAAALVSFILQIYGIREVWLMGGIGCLFLICSVYALYCYKLSQARLANIVERNQFLEECNATHEKSISKNILEVKEALDLADDAQKTKQSFIAGITHELRTPLNGVTGAIEVFKAANLDQDQFKWLSTIEDSAAHLTELIDSMVDFTDLEKGKIDLDNVNMDFSRILEDLIEEKYSLALRKGLKLSLSIDPQVPKVINSDPERFKQMITVFINNAIKFTRSGWIHVSVNELGKMGSKVHLEFSIEDTGIGIEPAKQRVIFEKLQQAESGFSRQYGGLGLGLNIASSVAELFGAKIRIKSELDKGSVFTVSMWADYVVRSRKAQAASTYAYQMEAIVVDPSIHQGQTICAQLNNLGLKTDYFENYLDALQLMSIRSEKKPLLIFLSLDVDNLEQFFLDKDKVFTSENIFLVSLHHKFVSSDGWPKRGEFMDLYLEPPVREDVLVRAVIDAGKILIDERKGEFRSERRERTSDKTPKILLVEDNLVNQTVAKALLEKLSCIVTIASDGAEALAYYQKSTFDMIVMDCQMPVMDGFEATGNIRAVEEQEGRKRTPIVALSANNSLSDRRKCREVGMDDFLAKPVRYRNLQHILSVYVDGNDKCENAS